MNKVLRIISVFEILACMLMIFGPAIVRPYTLILPFLSIAIADMYFYIGYGKDASKMSLGMFWICVAILSV